MFVWNNFSDLEFQHSSGYMHGALDMPFVPFILLADIDKRMILAGIAYGAILFAGDGRDLGFGFGNKVLGGSI